MRFWAAGLVVFSLMLVFMKTSGAAVPISTREVAELLLQEKRAAYEQERSDAVAMLAVCALRLNSQAYNVAAGRLQNVPIEVSAADKDFSVCADGGTLAFTFWRRVFACGGLARLSHEEQIQVILHEAYHLTGVTDECAATHAISTCLTALGAPVHHITVYFSRCSASSR